MTAATRAGRSGVDQGHGIRSESRRKLSIPSRQRQPPEQQASRPHVRPPRRAAQTGGPWYQPQRESWLKTWTWPRVPAESKEQREKREKSQHDPVDMSLCRYEGRKGTGGSRKGRRREKSGLGRRIRRDRKRRVGRPGREIPRLGSRPRREK
eukprot:3232010-Rhodomonas_salina.1